MQRIRIVRRLSRLVLILLFIEFLDELLFGIFEAAWPLIRNDFGLTYTQIGLLLSVPGIISAVIEPGIGLLGDVWRRRTLIVGGGILFAFSAFMTAAGESFAILMLALIAMYPASGAFVSLSQATLMDTDPERHEHNMARWTFAGSLGVVVGPIVLGIALTFNLGWRFTFVAWGALALAAAIMVATGPTFPINGSEEDDEEAGSWSQLKSALRSARSFEVWRWLILLQFSDFMLDGLYSYMALYMVDVMGMSATQAGWAIAVWTGVGLIGDLLLIPLLERINGITYLRFSVIMQLILYPAFLLVPSLEIKLIILGLMGLFNAGWYAILQGRLYTSMPGKSGTVMALSSVTGLVGSLLPLAIGVVATQHGLQTALWVLFLGPVMLFFGLPRR